VGVREHQHDAAKHAVIHIYPNPFRISTTITISMTQRAEGSELCIYDATGRPVRSFSFSTAYSLLPTPIVWNGTDDSGRNLPCGVYFVRLQAGTVLTSEKVMIIR